MEFLRVIPINLVSSRMRENKEKRGSQLLFLFFCERVLGYNWDLGFLKVFLYTIVFSLIIVKSLQLRGRRQIAKPRKYYLVRVIVFLWRVFSLFVLFLTGWDFGVIPYSSIQTDP